MLEKIRTGEWFEIDVFSPDSGSVVWSGLRREIEAAGLSLADVRDLCQKFTICRGELDHQRNSFKIALDSMRERVESDRQVFNANISILACAIFLRTAKNSTLIDESGLKILEISSGIEASVRMGNLQEVKIGNHPLAQAFVLQVSLQVVDLLIERFEFIVAKVQNYHDCFEQDEIASLRVQQRDLKADLANAEKDRDTAYRDLFNANREIDNLKNWRKWLTVGCVTTTLGTLWFWSKSGASAQTQPDPGLSSKPTQTK